MIGQKIASELKHEAVSTMKMLERLPDDKLDWKPHEKSMTLGRLASHTAELSGFITRILTSDEMDFLTREYVPTVVKSSEEAVALFKEKSASALAELEKVTDEKLMENWTMRNGDHVIFTMPRIAAIRGVGISHFIHHRGQLSVYLRMLDIPVPSIYGPSADETM
jgi:uncharacterized damage-inducible protein DinB